MEDLARLIAAAALVDIAQAEAIDAQAEEERVAAEQRAAAEADRARRAGRLDDRVVSWTITLIVIGTILALVLGIWAWHEAPSYGQLALHVWWAIVVTVLVIALAGAAAILVRWPWTGRAHRVGTAVVAGAAAIAGLVFSVPKLQYQNVMGTGFDFGGQFLTCGEPVRIPIQPDGGKTELWQMFRSQVKGTEGRSCNRVDLYRGKERVSAYTLPAGQWFLPDVAPDGGAAMFAAHNGVPLANSDIVDASLDAITFYARSDGGLVVSVSPADPTAWRS